MEIIGIDIGTTKIAGVLFDAFTNTIKKVISLDSNADISLSNEWERCQDVGKIIEKALQIIKRLKRAGSKLPVCIGISSQMHSFLYVDNDANPLSPLYTWQDGRAGLPLKRQGITAVEYIKERTGLNVPVGYAFSTHLYNKENALVPSGSCKIISIGSFLGMKLSKTRKVKTDPSECASFGLYDINTNQFLMNEIQGLFGSTQFLPEAVGFSQIYGFDEDKIPVYTSIGDNQASFIGGMIPDRDSLSINIGTGGQISFLVDQINNNQTNLEYRPFPGKKKLAVGATLAGGKAFSMLVDFFYEVINTFGGKKSKQDIYGIINSMPYKKPDYPLKVLPFFNGTRSDATARGEIQNIGINNLNIYNMIYGFSEAIVNELKEIYLKSRGDHNFKPETIIGSGNAVRKNILIRKIIQDSFDLPLIVSPFEEEAACGAAIYAYNSLKTGTP